MRGGFRMRRLSYLPALLPLAAASAWPAGYHVITKFKVGGEGGWDYLSADAQNRRLYVSHGTQVEVLDLDSGAVVARSPTRRACTVSRSRRTRDAASSATGERRP